LVAVHRTHDVPPGPWIGASIGAQAAQKLARPEATPALEQASQQAAFCRRKAVRHTRSLRLCPATGGLRICRGRLPAMVMVCAVTFQRHGRLYYADPGDL